LPWHPHTAAALEPLVPGEPVVEPAPTVTIYRDTERASSITLPIIE